MYSGVAAAPMSLALANACRRAGAAFKHGTQPVDELDCEDLNAEVYFYPQPATVLDAKSETSSMQLVAMADSASDDEVWVLCGSCDSALAVLYARQALAALFEHFQREHVAAVPAQRPHKRSQRQPTPGATASLAQAARSVVANAAAIADVSPTQNRRKTDAKLKKKTSINI